jgi:hypothetical protein
LPALLTTTRFLFAEPPKYVGAAIKAGTFRQDKINQELEQIKIFQVPSHTMRYASLED